MPQAWGGWVGQGGGFGAEAAWQPTVKAFPPFVKAFPALVKAFPPFESCAPVASEGDLGVPPKNPQFDLTADWPLQRRGSADLLSSLFPSAFFFLFPDFSPNFSTVILSLRLLSFFASQSCLVFSSTQERPEPQI